MASSSSSSKASAKGGGGGDVVSTVDPTSKAYISKMSTVVSVSINGKVFLELVCVLTCLITFLLT